MYKWIILAALVILAGGCSASGDKPEKTPAQKEEALRQWNGAHASVMASLARDQFKTGNLDKARGTIDDALKLEPTSAPLRVLSARIAIEQAQLERADTDLKIARESDPKNAEADYYAGIVYQRWQRPQEAFDFYQSASNKAPTELSYVLAAGEMLVATDRTADALGMLQEKTATFENSAALRDAIGQLLVQRGRYTEAIDTLRRASILASEDSCIREHLALALYYGKQYRESADVLTRLLKDPSYGQRADLFVALGQCQSHIDRPRDARSSFETAVRLQPGNSGAWLGLGRAAIQLKDNDRVELALKRAIALEPGNGDAYLLLGYLRLNQERFDDALTAFRKASAIEPDDVVGLCMVGYTLERMGKAEQAIQYFGQALKHKPEDELASRLMAGADLHE